MPDWANLRRLRHNLRSGGALAALFVLAACVSTQQVTPQLAQLNNDGITLLPPGQEIELSGGGIDVGSSVYGKYLAARHAEIEGEYAEAADLLLGVLAEQPDDPDLLRRTHLLLASEGRTEEAIELAERLVAFDDATPFANITLAIEESKTGEFDAAAERLGKLGRAGANQLLVPLLRAWALHGDGQTEAALAELETLAGERGFAVVEGLHSGLIADASGEGDLAESGFMRAIGAGPPPLRLALAYAAHLTREGQWDQAKRVLDDFQVQQADDLLIRDPMIAIGAKEELPLLVATPTDGMAEALVSVARALNREGGDLSALIYTRMALVLRPGDPMAMALLADVLSNQGRDDDAIVVLREIKPGSPYSWFARRSLARLLEGAGELEEAITLLRGMVDERPKRPEAAQTLGDLLRFNDRFEEAVEAYDVAVNRVSDLDERHWRLLYTRGIALERSKNWPRAEEDFLRALELQPEQPLVLNYLGYSWVEQGVNLDEARGMIEEAVARRPGDGFIVDSMGWVLYQLGEYEDAVVHLERAVALEPGDPIINDHLGDAYWLVGRANEARFQWNRALGVDPEPELEIILQQKLRGESLPDPKPIGERDS